MVDPSLTEEGVMEGRLVIGMNVHREICALQMTGGVAIEQEQVSVVWFCGCHVTCCCRHVTTTTTLR